MNAAQVEAAIRKYHAGAAILSEVCISTDPIEPLRRIDLLVWRTLLRTAVEIKVSRADFKRDTDEKRDAWRRHVHRFVYATPAGLLAPDEVPEGCGLWEIGPRGVTVRKRTTINRNAEPLPEAVVQAIAYRAMRAAK